jgi:hypothetical protein
MREKIEHECSQQSTREEKCDGTYAMEFEIPGQRDELQNTASFKAKRNRVFMRICDCR